MNQLKELHTDGDPDSFLQDASNRNSSLKAYY